MPSKQLLSDQELAAWEDSRDIGAELMQSVREMLLGQGQPIEISPIVAACAQSGLSRVRFAKLLGVSVRTLQAWERGRCKPSGAAQTLLRIAQRHPEVLRELNVA